jgi:hypothetical protein
MSTPDPTPTPTAPDWRALCRELRDAYAESQSIQHGPWVGSDHGPSPLLARADAALATPPAATREAGPLPQAPTAAAMVAAYFDRYDRTGPLEDPEPVCLAAALRAMPPGADLAAVIDALEVMG